jgi:nucleoid-associated protein YgaU
MGIMDKIFDKDDDKDKDKKKADFSDVNRSAASSSSASPAPGSAGSAGRADFSDVQSTSWSSGTAERARTYTVVAGDTLSKIAKREYGSAEKWHAIYEANRDKIKNPDLIHPGQVLTLPPNA